jgi:hypothetical protein
MTSMIQRTTAWLCLAVALLTGFTPAQGTVICLEPDGCVRIELAISAASCFGCGEHREDATPSSPVVRAPEVSDCPCVDLPVPGTSQERRLRNSIALRLGSWIANPVALTAPPLLPAPRALRALRLDPPRPPESLALIRSVVLLV